MRVLLTGSTGFLGMNLLPRLLARGDTVYALCHKNEPPTQHKRLHIVYGDILALEKIADSLPKRLDAVYHLAALVDLGHSRTKEVWAVNYDGTCNILSLCCTRKIPRLYYVGTVYTEGRNAYEISKRRTEEMLQKHVRVHGRPKLTIFKPSVIVSGADSSVPPAGAFFQFINVIARFHHRAETIRRSVEGTLRLPPVVPRLRIKGNEDGLGNIVPVESVVDFIAKTRGPGTFMLTNPNPPTIGEIADWVGETLLLDIKIEKDFQASTVEALLARLISSFIPYLQGEPMHSDLTACIKVDREYIVQALKRMFIGV